MAKRYIQRELDCDDPVDIVRRHVSRRRFIYLLGGDLRVREALILWSETPSAQWCVAQMLSSWQRGDDAAARRAWETERPNASASLLMALSLFAAPNWLGDWLADYALRFILQLFGPIEPWNVQLERPMASRKQRLPKGGWDNTIRNVNWFYRVKIKQPPDKVSEVAEEWAEKRQVEGVTLAPSRETGKADARHQVSDAIEAARIILELS
jgi:hypothetical protein